MQDINIQDESGDKKYFTIIPNYILNHSTLWDREVYIQMKRITGESGTCWTSQKTLAKQCGISINRLKKSINYLVEHEWIKSIGKKQIITKGGIQEVNEYKVIDLWDMNNNFYKAKGVSPDDTPTAKGVSRNEQRGVTGEAKGVSPDDDKEEPLLNNITINNTCEQSSRDIVDIINLFKTINPTIKFNNKTTRKAAGDLIKQFGKEKTLEYANYAISIFGTPYAPQITTPYELQEKLARLAAFYTSEKNKKQKVTVTKTF